MKIFQEENRNLHQNFGYPVCPPLGTRGVGFVFFNHHQRFTQDFVSCRRKWQCSSVTHNHLSGVGGGR